MSLAAPHQQVLAVRGELCLLEVPALRARIDRSIDAGARHLVLDLSGCTLLTAGALRLLAATDARLRGVGGGLQLRDPRPLAARVLALTGLDRLL